MILFTFLRNRKTKEIHRLKFSNRSCGIQYMRHGRKCTKIWALYLVKFRGYNGCVHCWKKQDR